MKMIVDEIIENTCQNSVTFEFAAAALLTPADSTVCMGHMKREKLNFYWELYISMLTMW